jgi:hypothetical protein
MLRSSFLTKNDMELFPVTQSGSHSNKYPVSEARAEIQGPSEKYLKPGSGLRLQCNVLQSTELPTYVFWYHNNRMINYDVDRGINVTTTLSEKTSVLTITSAATHHSGNYSCVPSNAQSASTYVHILNGNTIIFVTVIINCCCYYPFPPLTRQLIGIQAEVVITGVTTK